MFLCKVFTDLTSRNSQKCCILPMVLNFLTFTAVTNRRRDLVNRKLVGVCSDSIVTIGTVRRVTTLFQWGASCLEMACRADDLPVG